MPTPRLCLCSDGEKKGHLISSSIINSSFFFFYHHITPKSGNVLPRVAPSLSAGHCVTLFRVSLQRSARAVAEESDALFTQLIRSIELKRFEVRELIKAQEKTAISQADQLLEKIEKEIADLKMNEAELDKLLHIEDHINFLQVTANRFLFFFTPLPPFRRVSHPAHPDLLVWFCHCRAASLSRLHLSCQLCPLSRPTPASPLAP